MEEPARALRASRAQLAMKRPLDDFLPPRPPDIPAPEPKRAADWRWFWAVIGLATVLRLAFFVGHTKTAFFSQPVLDARFLFETAESVAAGDIGGDDLAFNPPLYPAFLGLAYKVIHPEFRLALTYLVHHVLGVLAVALVYLTGFRVAGRWTATLGALLAATYGPLAALSNDTLDTAPIALCAVATLYLLIRAATAHGLEYPFLAGCALAVWAQLTPAAYAFVPVALGRMLSTPTPERSKISPFVTARGLPATRHGRWSAPFALLAPVAMAAGFYGIIAKAQTGEFTPIPSRVGAYFYLGNAPGTADGAFIHLPRPETRFVERPLDPVEEFARAQYARRAAHEPDDTPPPPPSPLQLTGFWLAETFREIIDRPLDWLALLAQKSLMAINRVEASDHTGYAFVREINPFARWWPSTYGFIAFFAVLGLQRAFRYNWAWPRHWVWLMATAQAVCLVAFLVTTRWRAPLVPAMCVLAALGLQRTWQFFGRRSRLRRGWRFAAPCLVALALVVWIDWFGFSRRRPGRDWWRYGWAAYQANEWGLASRALDRAASLGETSSRLHVYRGRCHLLNGQTREAVRAYKRAVLADPTDGEGYYAFALIFLEKGEYRKAVGFLKTAVALAPGNPDFLAALGLAYLRGGDEAEAYRRLSLAHAWNPNHVAALVGLSEVENRRGNSQRSRRLLLAAMNLDGAMTRIFVNQIERPIPPEALATPPFSVREGETRVSELEMSDETDGDGPGD